jgi:hypothetical protein
MNLLAISEPSSSWVWPVLASVGGFFVFVGLLMEKGAEGDWFRNAKDLRRQKSKAKWGWRFLMFGIFVEIVIGCALAWKDEKDMEQAKQNERMILNKTPGKMPIFTAAAFASIHLATNSISTNTMQGVWKTGFLRFFGTNLQGAGIQLGSDDAPLWWGPEENITVSLQFSWKAGDPVLGRYTTADKSADDLISDMTHFSLISSFIHLNTQVLGGRVTLVLNGAVAKTFEIPEQTISFPHGDIRNF